MKEVSTHSIPWITCILKTQCLLQYCSSSYRMTPESCSNHLHLILSVPQYSVRSMRRSDIDAVAALEQLVFPGETWSIDDYHDIVNDPTYNCCILENMNSADPPILGYGIQYTSRGRTHITSFAIHPARQGCGLGRILLKRMIEHASLAGDSVVDLEVNVFNERARRLYVRHGFRILETLPEYYRDRADAYRMRLLLWVIDVV